MFYLIHSSSLSKHCYAWDNLSFIDWKGSVCDNCGRIVHKACMAEGNMELELDGGKEHPDFLQFTGAGPRLFLLSKHALDIFEKNNITGIASAQPVMLSWIKSKAKRAITSPIPEYYSLEIDGRIDYCLQAMFLKKKKVCQVCGQFEWNRERRPTVVVSESTWNGSDLCRISSVPGFSICTQKLYDVIKANKLTGFELEPVSAQE